jgi:DHA1 family bicyclomycin/chloramphenicol resistance-like MFS transporter
MTVAAIIAAVIVYLFGMGILIPTGSSLSLQAVSAQRAGAATALAGSMQMGFAALGTLFVSLIDAVPGLDFAVVMAVCGFAAVAALAAAARALPVHGAGASP